MPVDVPRDALVVRGGDPHDPQNLLRMLEQAQVSHDRGCGYALSTGVGYDPSRSREELIADIATACKLPQTRLAVTTVGDILDNMPFAITPDGPLPSHANIDLGSDLNVDIVKQFIELFRPAEVNPVYQQFRKGR
ncbi:MAG TPA: hypothetical protein VN840_05160 [Streptosporangiaceae bacterium]|nr:hypothetical protein [Streptosporangiaceae bacterium]